MTQIHLDKTLETNSHLLHIDTTNSFKNCVLNKIIVQITIVKLVPDVVLNII